MRDSLTAFDQVLAFCDSSVSDEDVVTLIGAVDPRLLADISAAVFTGDTQGVLAGIKRVDMVGYNMRQFCQDLIEHFRYLLVIRSVKKPEEILDLADAELEELRQQAAGFSAQDIQRRLTLLIKADGEMAFASFQRLILEMALLKAAILVPVIPINELIEKIKMLETGAVHTPSLPWNAGRPAVSGEGVSSRPEPQRVASPPATASAQVSAPLAPKTKPHGSHSDWERFVAFAVEKRPAIGSVLEHGSPLKLEPGLMEIGFPSGSYYLNSAQDADSVKEIQELAQEFNGAATAVKIKSITPETGDSPLSLAEKKKSDVEQRMKSLKQEVAEHPVINEALRLFGGTITDIRET
jgi:DNA polymerase-3 subunit gamma/tau